eukprot:CAMPEP_0118674188 /NCGR_PEP_ID=MMETSP0800-20121206/750_1 /TAXON_ID=210618 ORGANISM="Striatella unipunctata, Strain CCMP2910" /NCGR_SAMPLE_ID=MMETSP0800 /ASSEMBLY_ACC=CAM_ASM_000638 /LENGTH=394 /DNA_ID=CAMNT_0006569357 /DNA_START=22 /DNA_END=1206 /DNA_ORIENTATION=+
MEGIREVFVPSKDTDKTVISVLDDDDVVEKAVRQHESRRKDERLTTTTEAESVPTSTSRGPPSRTSGMFTGLFGARKAMESSSSDDPPPEKKNFFRSLQGETAPSTTKSMIQRLTDERRGETSSAAHEPAPQPESVLKDEPEKVLKDEPEQVLKETPPTPLVFDPEEGYPDNPHLIHHKLVISSSKAYANLFTQMRDVNSDSAQFVFYARRAMRLLAEDAIAELPHEKISITTPCGLCEGIKPIPAERLCAVSIIRAGDALLECVRECLPNVPVGKILIQRDESTKEKKPKLYYGKLPPDIADKDGVILCDPMLATGGSAKMAINTLVQVGVHPEKIIFANVICCPEGLHALALTWPQVKIVTAQVDQSLNDEKFIVPGLGDYGDRFFNTIAET